MVYCFLKGIGVMGHDMHSKMARKESLNKDLCHQFLMDVQIGIAAID